MIMYKKCTLCELNKHTSLFHKSGAGRVRGECIECRALLRKNKTNTPKEMYYRQKHNSSIRGHAPPDYTRQELMDWCFVQPLYHELHKAWAASNYNKNYTPSCDRINDYKPYTLDNIQLMTWEENKRKGEIDRVQGINNKQSRAVTRTANSTEVEFYSIRQAARETGIPQTNIVKCCKGTRKSAGGYTWKYKCGRA